MIISSRNSILNFVNKIEEASSVDLSNYKVDVPELSCWLKYEKHESKSKKLISKGFCNSEYYNVLVNDIKIATIWNSRMQFRIPLPINEYIKFKINNNDVNCIVKLVDNYSKLCIETDIVNYVINKNGETKITMECIIGGNTILFKHEHTTSLDKIKQDKEKYLNEGKNQYFNPASLYDDDEEDKFENTKIDSTTRSARFKSSNIDIKTEIRMKRDLIDEKIKNGQMKYCGMDFDAALNSDRSENVELPTYKMKLRDGTEIYIIISSIKKRSFKIQIKIPFDDSAKGKGLANGIVSRNMAACLTQASIIHKSDKYTKFNNISIQCYLESDWVLYTTLINEFIEKYISSTEKWKLSCFDTPGCKISYSAPMKYSKQYLWKSFSGDSERYKLKSISSSSSLLKDTSPNLQRLNRIGNNTINCCVYEVDKSGEIDVDCSMQYISISVNIRRANWIRRKEVDHHKKKHKIIPIFKSNSKTNFTNSKYDCKEYENNYGFMVSNGIWYGIKFSEIDLNDDNTLQPNSNSNSNSNSNNSNSNSNSNSNNNSNSNSRSSISGLNKNSSIFSTNNRSYDAFSNNIPKNNIPVIRNKSYDDIINCEFDSFEMFCDSNSSSDPHTIETIINNTSKNNKKNKKHKEVLSKTRNAYKFCCI